MFCGLIAFSLSEYESTVKYSLKLRKDKGSIIYYFCQYTNQVCIFSCCLDMAIDLFNCCDNPYMKREGLNCLCVLVVSRFICGKDIYSRLYFQRGELPIHVVPSDDMMSPKGFLQTTFILVNSNHQLTSTSFWPYQNLLCIESQVYITSPHYSFQLNTFIPCNQNGAIWLTFKAVDLTSQLYFVIFNTKHQKPLEPGV